MIPMTPEKYSDHKVIYPAIIQPYLRGIRTLYQDGAFQSECSWSSEINKLAEELQDIFPIKVILDGVIHNGEYHVFDIVNFNTPFKRRFDAVSQILRDSKNYHHVIIVPTQRVLSEKAADDQFNKWLNEGYTGMIYRLGNCPYTKPTPKNPQNRSNQLLLREVI